MNEYEKNTVTESLSKKVLAFCNNPVLFAILFSVYFKCSFNEGVPFKQP